MAGDNVSDSGGCTNGVAVENNITKENQDELTMKQQESIAAEIAENTKLVTALEDFTPLLSTFTNDPVYTTKLTQIAKSFANVRRTRPDGNCFFRSWGFRLFEYLMTDEKKLEEFKSKIKPSKDEMIQLGMPAFTVEDFYDNFMDTLERLSGDDKMSVKELEDLFNDEGMSNYLVVFLRLLVSKQLQLEAEFYQNFIEGEIPLKDFCATEVEPMFKESDHIHIIGLTAATGITVRVIYLDRGGDKVQEHDFPEDGSAPVLHLIYRPGHYDILYPK
eukprot:TRINITY_DN7974_c0_g1_i4.p1 TRINITY_DN7974_c0_g1~~TRINITY_DN7974_c0_g1_i4.p1  ORF type:complete len:275 (+),score=72.96 TRINITY_DN7974_c0_g1_i4:43-867(+)